MIKLYRAQAPDGEVQTLLFDADQARPWVRWSQPLEALHAQLMAGALASSWGELEEAAALAADAALLAPAAPSKVVCIGLNYAHHAQEMNKPLPKEPLMFLKPSTAVIGPGEAIVLPAQSSEVHHEAELALVVGRRASRVSEAEAMSYILGFSCANDVTARDIQRQENRYTRAKGFDTFCPFGPAIALNFGDFDPMRSRVSCQLNGQTRQDSPIDDLIFSLPYLVHFVSHVMTLLPGDIILTGTPMGVGPMQAGDMVSVEIEGIGALSNVVISAS